MPLQAMQYASPKAIWNLLFGVSRPTFEKNEGNDIFHQIVSYVRFLSSFPLYIFTFMFPAIFLFKLTVCIHSPSVLMNL